MENSQNYATPFSAGLLTGAAMVGGRAPSGEGKGLSPVWDRILRKPERRYCHCAEMEVHYLYVHNMYLHLWQLQNRNLQLRQARSANDQT